VIAITPCIENDSLLVRWQSHPTVVKRKRAMKLRKLHIEDYKMFKDFDIDFLDENDEALPIVVLAGVNGSGKTTLLEYIKNFSGMLDINKNSKDLLELTHRDEINYINLKLKERYELADLMDTSSIVGRALNIMSNFLNSLIYFESGIDDTKKVADEFVKTFYFYLKEKDYRPSEITQYFTQYMKDIFNDLDIGFQYSHLDKEDKVWFTSNDSDRYYYTNKDNGEQVLFGIDELSTGQKTLLSKILYIYFKDYKDKVILIDEPELSLHPRWQSQVLSVYEKLAEKNECQIIIATHSPQIMASAKNEYIRLLVKEENQILVKELNGSPLDRDTNTMLKTIMGANYIPKELETLRSEYRRLFNENLEDTPEAKELEKKILEWESPNSSFWQSIAFDKELRSI